MARGRGRLESTAFLSRERLLELLLGAAVLGAEDGLLLDLGEMLHRDVSIDARGEAGATLLDVIGVGLTWVAAAVKSSHKAAGQSGGCRAR